MANLVLITLMMLEMAMKFIAHGPLPFFRYVHPLE
jgi:hypothetical protein